MAEEKETKTFAIKITADPEFVEVLNQLEIKVKHMAWDGIENLSTRDLTRILARKIKSSKMFQ
jgi:hypothetical protein